MISWIWANKEWFFSGIGVFVLGLVLSLIFKKFTNAERVKQTQKSGANSTNIQIGGDLKQ